MNFSRKSYSQYLSSYLRAFARMTHRKLYHLSGLAGEVVQPFVCIQPDSAAAKAPCLTPQLRL